MRTEEGLRRVCGGTPEYPVVEVSVCFGGWVASVKQGRGTVDMTRRSRTRQRGLRLRRTTWGAGKGSRLATVRVSQTLVRLLLRRVSTGGVCGSRLRPGRPEWVGGLQRLTPRVQWSTGVPLWTGPEGGTGGGDLTESKGLTLVLSLSGFEFPNGDILSPPALSSPSHGPTDPSRRTNTYSDHDGRSGRSPTDGGWTSAPLCPRSPPRPRGG